MWLFARNSFAKRGGRYRDKAEVFFRGREGKIFGASPLVSGDNVLANKVKEFCANQETYKQRARKLTAWANRQDLVAVKLKSLLPG